MCSFCFLISYCRGVAATDAALAVLEAAACERCSLFQRPHRLFQVKLHPERRAALSHCIGIRHRHEHEIGMVGLCALQEHNSLSGPDAGIFRGCCRKEVKETQGTVQVEGSATTKHAGRACTRACTAGCGASPTLLWRVLYHWEESPNHLAPVEQGSETFF